MLVIVIVRIMVNKSIITPKCSLSMEEKIISKL